MCSISSIHPVIIIKSKTDALNVLKKIKPDHYINFIKVINDQYENKFNTYLFECSKCYCTFNVFTENMISNCIIMSHDNFDDSCNEIVMDKVCH